MFIEIEYYKCRRSDNSCIEETSFKSTIGFKGIVNINLISSLSDLYLENKRSSVLTMSNSDRYYLREDFHFILKEQLLSMNCLIKVPLQRQLSELEKYELTRPSRLSPSCLFRFINTKW